MAQAVWRPPFDPGPVAGAVDGFAVGVDAVSVADVRGLLGVAVVARSMARGQRGLPLGSYWMEKKLITKCHFLKKEKQKKLF